ncbi:SAM-dependent methyltransferase [Thiorhodococcus mannitoliphagus]|uniref:SAM-dependent methyltransferase n=1 Tax=Thiorhodococcus mannitoliphagus TaxID=329406 RepID=A0A6P1DU78_9GAMM|nr:SAM-dependent methyltransferase [Thiorhodococcus mannitoliphagus]NEX21658.1 SAM-dependent methyltransferase [Thiorhodococcus mannitoliphagus]
MSNQHAAPEASEPDIQAEISARLNERIRGEITAAGGLLPFDRFMELALYAPGLGYYVAGAQKLGAAGDFVTAPEVSALFGRCVGNQCAEVLQELGGGDVFEIGAGSGALAVHILAHLEQIGTLPHRYRILEPSPDLQARQRALLRAEIPQLAERCEWLVDLPRDLRGAVVANEVLDAMPVHRFQVGPAGTILEVFVSNAGERLTEITAPPRSPGLTAAVAALQSEGLACAHGYSSEVNLRLAPWMKALADSLTAGLVLLIDYGYPRSAYYQADRHMGTLMCHYRHQAHDDPYRRLGLQDITAHVDFTAVVEAGAAAGLELEGFTTQANFLIGCGIDHILADAEESLDLAQGVKQLLLPTAMGERFKVMGLGKKVSGPWSGFCVRDLSDRL